MNKSTKFLSINHRNAMQNKYYCSQYPSVSPLFSDTHPRPAGAWISGRRRRPALMGANHLHRERDRRVGLDHVQRAAESHRHRRHVLALLWVRARAELRQKPIFFLHSRLSDQSSCLSTHSNVFFASTDHCDQALASRNCTSFISSHDQHLCRYAQLQTCSDDITYQTPRTSSCQSNNQSYVTSSGSRLVTPIATAYQSTCPIVQCPLPSAATSIMPLASRWTALVSIVLTMGLAAISIL